MLLSTATSCHALGNLFISLFLSQSFPLLFFKHFLFFSLSPQKISERAFDGLNNLQKLNLENNRLKLLERGVFTGAPALIYLNLMKNSLETITYNNILPLMDNLVNNTKSKLDITGAFGKTIYSCENEALAAFRDDIYDFLPSIVPIIIPAHLIARLLFTDLLLSTLPRPRRNLAIPLARPRVPDNEALR
jgi:Leucine rich repeat